MSSKPIIQLAKLTQFNTEAQLDARVAALERDRSIAAAGFQRAAVEQRRALLRRILRQAAFLRSCLVAEGLDVVAERGGVLGEGEGACWVDAPPQSQGEGEAGDEALLKKARERCDSVESDG